MNNNKESVLQGEDFIAPAILALVSASTAFFVFYCGVRLISSDIAETRGQEPLILTGVMKIMAGGGRLYTHPNAPPFDLVQYTPLYYYLVAYAARMAGCVAGDAEGVTRVGRVLSSGLAVAHLAVFLLVCVRVLRIRPVFAVAAAAMVWVLHAPWDFLARPDALVSLCFLGATGLALLGLTEESISSRRTNLLFACASALGFVAFMAKQNGAQIVIILLVFSLLRRDWRRGAIVAAIPSALLLFAATAGPAWFGKHYVENAIGGLNNGVRPYAAFVTTYVPVFLQLNVAALAGLATYAVSGWVRGTASRQQHFLAIALIVTFVLAAFSATKLGSAPHHYNDFLTLLVLVLAYWLNSVCRESPENSRAVHWAVAVFAVLFFSSNAVAFRESFVTPQWRHFSAYDEIVPYMRKELRDHPEDSFFTVDYTLPNFFPDRVVVPQYSLSGIMYARGLLDYSAVQSQMDSGKVRWLLVGTDQDITRQLGFIGLKPQKYTRTVDVSGFAIWTHEPSDNLPKR